MTCLSRAGRSFLLPALFFYSFLLVNKAHAGAWVRDPNSVYVQMMFGYYQSDTIFDRLGDQRPNRIFEDPNAILLGLENSTYRQFEGVLYLEYGLPYDFEFVASFPFFRSAQQDSDIGKFIASGIGDTVVGLKYKWFDRSEYVASAQVDIGIPSGNASATGSVPGRADQIIPLGDDEWDYAIRILCSRGFYPIPLYVTADIGYRFRTSVSGVDFVDDLPWTVEGGYTFSFDRRWFSALTTSLNFNGVLSTKNLDAQTALVINTASNVSGTSPYQEFIDIQPGIFLTIVDKLSFVANYSYTIAGKNTGSGWTIRSGFAWEH